METPRPHASRGDKLNIRKLKIMTNIILSLSVFSVLKKEKSFYLVWRSVGRCLPTQFSLILISHQCSVWTFSISLGFPLVEFQTCQQEQKEKLWIMTLIFCTVLGFCFTGTFSSGGGGRERSRSDHVGHLTAILFHSVVYSTGHFC